MPFPTDLRENRKNSIEKLHLYIENYTEIDLTEKSLWNGKRYKAYQSTEPYRPMVDIATEPFLKMFGYIPAPNRSMHRL